jgi:hypothetical protein
MSSFYSKVWLNLDRLGQLRNAWVAPEKATISVRRDDRWIAANIPELDPVDTFVVLE